jgi:hypothetical protein
MKKMQNQELDDLVLHIKYYHVNKIKENEKEGACGMDVEGTRTHRMLTGRSEGQRQIGILRRRWQDNIKLDLQEIV